MQISRSKTVDLHALKKMLPHIVASARKMGKAISLTVFLAEDGSTGGGSLSVPKPVSRNDLEDVSTTWHSNDDNMCKAPPTDHCSTGCLAS